LKSGGDECQKSGVSGLASLSRRPHTSLATKTGDRETKLILKFRTDRILGARRIQSELFRQHNIALALATIHKVLKKNKVKPVRKFRRKHQYKRYQRPIPGNLVQMDTCKIGPRLFQYTAVDDCTRYRALRLHDRHTAANRLRFINRILDEMSFPVQRFQTDRGSEFFALKVQKISIALGIKYRLNKPVSPHLNGKVERSQ
jgi:transposase InsO family protein